MVQRRNCIVVFVLGLLLLSPYVLGVGPNFWLLVTDAGVAYSASFSVSGGNSVSDSDTKDFEDLDPGGYLLYWDDISQGSGGTLAAETASTMQWFAALDDGLTEASSAGAAALIMGATTATGTASFTAIGASSTATVSESGDPVNAETEWQTSWAYCGFLTEILGYVSGGSGGATATVTWAPGLSITTTWTSASGYTTIGSYLIVGVTEIVSNDDPGIEETASFKIEIKGSPSTGVTDDVAVFGHTASVGIGMGSLGNSAEVSIDCVAHTDIVAYGTIP
jgi:hypothetical protein